jgi:hypothetical protein
MAARSTKSFTDLQRELIATQVEQRRAATREAAANSSRILADDLASARSAPRLTVLDG